jgi:hypothetical protein
MLRFGQCTWRVLSLSRGRFHEPSLERDGPRFRPGDCRAGLGASADEPKSRRCAVHVSGCSVRTRETHAADSTISYGPGPILNDRERDRADAEAPRDAPSAPWAPRGALRSVHRMRHAPLASRGSRAPNDNIANQLNSQELSRLSGSSAPPAGYAPQQGQPQGYPQQGQPPSRQRY